ncbi:V-type ATP synthase subunit A [Trichlorobacter ammonificans]|uniref:V-type ATP synthase alpha chain n=1 Tax=Trichlorobacter ammonificans TaxID=2916410 RepID=A0ABM9DAE1_9BACT|nr:V-type ATP synthase subunit A [Trichlorobacter ammonificans]CAH2032126.1 V-type ATP synthase alpha chain [Trichlorobacter ammonificans]
MNGVITGIAGPTVTVELTGLTLYEIVLVGSAGLTGEVVRLERDRAVVQVYEDTRGLALGEPVRGTARPLVAQLGPGLLGGMYDGLQRPLEKLLERDGPFIGAGSSASLLDSPARWNFVPLREAGETVRAGEVIGHAEEGRVRHLVTAPRDGELAALTAGAFSLCQEVGRYADGTPVTVCCQWPVRRPRPCRRRLPPAEPLVTGQRVVDFLYPLARGGTAIIPGGFGTGKTILEQAVAKFADVDLVVYVGCGERGNEMAELLEEFASLSDPWTGRRLMERTIVVANTSNMPVAAREASIYTAVTMAEYFRDMGCHVLLLADSISRWAEALREISSSLEEMPGEEGYPTYLASRMAGFMERAGVVETVSGAIGSLSMILSVSPPGGDFTEPVTQACLRTAGAFLMLDAALAHRRHFPAVNWFQSYSLYEQAMEQHFARSVSAGWVEARRGCRGLLQREEALREVAEIVGHEGMQEQDRLILHSAERIRQEFLCQGAYGEDAFSPPSRTVALIDAILADHRRIEQRLAAGETLDAALEKGGGDAAQ